MKIGVTMFLVSLAAFMAGPAAADRDGVCPMGAGVCYTPYCEVVLGHCSPKPGSETNRYVDFVGYDGTAGSYAISLSCSNGKDLSHVTVQDNEHVIKYEAGIDELPEVEFVDDNGDVKLSANSVIKKCGDKCIWYGRRGYINCNPSHN